jgi:hypothetical protein
MKLSQAFSHNQDPRETLCRDIRVASKIQRYVTFTFQKISDRKIEDIADVLPEGGRLGPFAPWHVRHLAERDLLDFFRELAAFYLIGRAYSVGDELLQLRDPRAGPDCLCSPTSRFARRLRWTMTVASPIMFLYRTEPLG